MLVTIKCTILIVLLFTSSLSFCMESEEESPTNSFIVIEPERELKQLIKELKAKLAASNIELLRNKEKNDKQKFYAIRSGSAKCIKMYTSDEAERKHLLNLQEYQLVSQYGKHYFEILVRYNNLCLFKRFKELDTSILQGIYRIALSQKSKKFISYLENNYNDRQLLSPDHVLELLQDNIKHFNLGSLKLLFKSNFWKNFSYNPPQDKESLLKYGLKKSSKVKFKKGQDYFDSLLYALRKTIPPTENTLNSHIKAQSLQIFPDSATQHITRKTCSALY